MDDVRGEQDPVGQQRGRGQRHQTINTDLPMTARRTIASCASAARAKGARCPMIGRTRPAASRSRPERMWRPQAGSAICTPTPIVVIPRSGVRDANSPLAAPWP